MRKSSIDLQNVNVYNNFLKGTIKAYSTGQYSAFWKNIFVPEGSAVSLISTSECSKSSVTDSESEDFLLIKQDADCKQVVATAVDDDDMFMNME
jgi:hypothetical protein